MTFVRRNPLQSAVGALLAVGLLVSTLVIGPTGAFRNASRTCTGFGYQAGYGYGYGYDSTYGYGCPPPGGGGGTVTPRSNHFAQGDVFVAQPGQSVTLSGSSGDPNTSGDLVQDPFESTAASAHESS